MSEVWSVSLEVTAAATWLLRGAGRRSPSGTWREVRGHQPWPPALGNPSTDPPWEIQMTFGYECSGDPVRTSEASFLLKEMSLLSQGLQTQRHTTHTGHSAGPCYWDIKMEP